ncbi:TRAP transporter small permease [Martelella limonii]|uniref:TRAP transporter small permease n=1 Tax=Martelella limonii TaxID=1647649 RepID=UPI0019D62A6A|nr:TRAP transporter small permease subunit [Martelella limonii]
METLLGGAWSIVTSIGSWDSWTISEALGSNGAWLVGLIVTILGGLLVAFLYARLPFVERHLEKFFMIWSYLLIATILAVEVVRRFAFSVQEPWSTTLPPFLFLIMAWAGCAYNMKFRNHLSFAEFRSMLPRAGQFACLVLDAVMWTVFCWVVIVTSTRVVFNSAANFQILLGTDNVLQWWLLTSVPVSFLLMAGRAFENLAIDYRNYRTGEPLIAASAQFGD